MKTTREPVDLSTLEAFLRQAPIPPISEFQKIRMVRNALIARSPAQPTLLRARLAVVAAAGILCVGAAIVFLHRSTAPVKKGEVLSGTIELETGDVLRVSEDAQYTVVSSAFTHRKVILKRGRIDFDIEPLGSGRGFTVFTPHCRIEVTGTRFEVTVAGGQSDIEIAEGTVDVFLNNHLAKRLVAGNRASFGSDVSGVNIPPSHEIPARAVDRETDGNEIPTHPSPSAVVNRKLDVSTESREQTRQKRALIGYGSVKALVVAGSHEDALAAIDAHLSKQKDNGRWLKLKGETLSAMGRYDDAAATLSKAARASRGDDAVRCGYLAADLYLTKLEQPQPALEMLHRVDATGPDSLLQERSRVLEVKALLRLGKSADAKMAARAYLQQFPNTSAATWMKSVL